MLRWVYIIGVRLLSIHFIPRGGLSRFNYKGHYEGAKGIYDDRRMAIIVFTDAPIRRQLVTLLHEFIHFFIAILSGNHHILRKLWRQWEFDCYWQFARRILCGGRGLRKMILTYRMRKTGYI